MKTPPHYTSTATPIERLPEAYKEGFIIGNIIKYASRAGLKDSFEDDLNKCLHYCQMLMELRAGKVEVEPTTTIFKDQPEPVYNQIVGRGTRVATHPEPKGHVPPLPEGVTIPDNGYQLGLEDVLDRKTDWFRAPNEWLMVQSLHGHKVKELPNLYAYRIYK